MLKTSRFSASRKNGDRGRTWPRTLLVAAFLFLLVLVPLSELRADPVVELGSEETDNSEEAGGLSLIKPSPKVEIFTEFTTGYDDNFRTQPDGDGAWFVHPQVSLAYRSPKPNQELSLLAGLGLEEYFTERTKLNSFVDLAFARPITRRLSVSTTLDFAYRSEPDFATNVGPNTFRGNYYTVNLNLAANYALTHRVSLVSSYGLQFIRYEDEITAALTDRESHSFGEQLRYAYSRRTSFTADYRYLLVDYVTAPRDSMTHFLLAGVDHVFSPNLHGEVRAGASIRRFEFGDTQVNPDVEWQLTYKAGRNDLSWTGSYSVEESATAFAQDQTTFRTGLLFRHEFTDRLSSSLSFYYHHDNRQQLVSPFFSGSLLNQDAVQANLNLRYDVTSRLNVNLGYSHSQVFSDSQLQEYARNRYFVGMGYRF